MQRDWNVESICDSHSTVWSVLLVARDAVLVLFSSTRLLDQPMRFPLSSPRSTMLSYSNSKQKALPNTLKVQHVSSAATKATSEGVTGISSPRWVKCRKRKGKPSELLGRRRRPSIPQNLDPNLQRSQRGPVLDSL